MPLKKGDKPRGNKKSKVEIEIAQNEMFNLLCRGMSKQSIIKFIQDKYNISERTVWRYWSTMFSRLGEKYEETADKELKAFSLKAKKRIEEAAMKYFSKKTPEWMKLWSDEEHKYMKFLQSIGVIEEVPRNVKIEGSLELTPYQALENVIDEYAKKKKS